MTHLSDDELVLLFYREGGDLGRIEAHVASCAACRQRFEALTMALREVDSAPIPRRDESYGAEVWARLQPRLLEASHARRWRDSITAVMTWPRLAASGALAALLLAAFLAGRSSVPSARPSAPAAEPAHAEAQSDAVRERMLLAAVGSHLDRSRVVLTEIAHRNGGGAADISPERATATDLVAANRLYRQAAVRNGDAAVAGVLEDLERVLVEIANSPSPASHDDLARWRDQIQTKGLLFKVTVMGSRVRERQQDAAGAPRPGTKTST
jgi:hypothetical protein